MDILVGLYESIDVPLDEYLLRSDLGTQLSERFTTATKRFVKKSVLVAALMAHRKRGLLPCLVEEDAARPFTDIDVVEHKRKRA